MIDAVLTRLEIAELWAKALKVAWPRLAVEADGQQSSRWVRKTFAGEVNLVKWGGLMVGGVNYFIDQAEVKGVWRSGNGKKEMVYDWWAQVSIWSCLSKQYVEWLNGGVKVEFLEILGLTWWELQQASVIALGVFGPT